MFYDHFLKAKLKVKNTAPFLFQLNIFTESLHYKEGKVVEINLTLFVFWHQSKFVVKDSKVIKPFFNGMLEKTLFKRGRKKAAYLPSISLDAFLSEGLLWTVRTWFLNILTCLLISKHSDSTWQHVPSKYDRQLKNQFMSWVHATIC